MFEPELRSGDSLSQLPVNKFLNALEPIESRAPNRVFPLSGNRTFPFGSYVDANDNPSLYEVRGSAEDFPLEGARI